MKKLTLTSPLLLALACVPFACGGEDDDSGNGSGDGDTGTSGDGDISLGTGEGGLGSQLSGPKDGGVVELTSEEADAITNASCTGWAAEGENIPAVLQFVVDVSGSMDQDAPGSRGQSKWDVTHDALLEAIDDLPASVAVGMLFYPNVNRNVGDSTLQPKDVSECIAVDELVDVQPLLSPGSDHRNRIEDALNAARPNYLTPTHDAFNYALEFGLEPYPSAARKFMLLITDGAPTMSQGCAANGNDIGDMPTDVIVDDIAAAHDEGISSFIIGAPGSEESFETGTDKRPWLSEAAQVGGTASDGCQIDGPNFCHMDMTQEPDFAEALRTGLAAIAGQIIDSCTFVVPEPPEGEEIDPDKTNVVVRRGNGDIVLVLPDAIGDCSEGWQFNEDGNVELCDKSCDDIKLDASASVQLTFGCGVDEVLPVR